jgi:uncharacterized membrane protein
MTRVEVNKRFSAAVFWTLGNLFHAAAKMSHFVIDVRAILLDIGCFLFYFDGIWAR